MPAREMRSSKSRSIRALVASGTRQSWGSSTNWRRHALHKYLGFSLWIEPCLIIWSLWHWGHCTQILFSSFACSVLQHHYGMQDYRIGTRNF
jgi:hypothetical protein